MSATVINEKQVIEVTRNFAGSLYGPGKVALDMRALIAQTSAVALSHMEQWETLLRGEFYTALEVYSVTSGRRRRPLTWLDMLSRDGYVRERVLNTLAGPAPNAFWLLLILRRCNDWVAQIRTAACRCVERLVQETPPNIVANALFSLFAHWGSWTRIQPQERQRLLLLTEYPQIKAQLQQNIIGATAGPASRILAQIGRHSALDDVLLDIAETAIQPSVRARAYRSLFEKRMVWIEDESGVSADTHYYRPPVATMIGEREISHQISLPQLLHRAVNDRSVRVRRVAGDAVINNAAELGAQALELAQRFTADSSESMVERGQFLLRRYGGEGQQ